MCKTCHERQIFLSYIPFVQTSDACHTTCSIFNLPIITLTSLQNPHLQNILIRPHLFLNIYKKKEYSPPKDASYINENEYKK